MRPRLAAAISGMLLAMLLPATVAAEPAVRFEDHHIGFFCEQEIDGGFVSAHIDVGTFGSFGGAEVWLDPALPFEEPPTLFGGSEDVTLIATAGGFELSASFTVFDANNEELGTGTIEATLTPSGPIQVFDNDRFGNRITLVEGTFQPMDASGTLTLPEAGTLEFGPCGGDETFIKALETNPHAFAIHNAGIAMNCFWDVEGSFAGLFAIDDSFGEFADAFLDAPDFDLFTATFSGLEFNTEAMSVAFDLFDPVSGDSASAAAEASLTPLGDPVSSVIQTSTSRDKVLEQRLSATGSLDFSTGASFEIDDGACFTNTFDSHQVNSGPSGPRPGGRAPLNDTSDGAISLSVGDQTTTKTGGAAIEPELQTTTCEAGEEDKFGRTVWYTLEGTGGDVTFDTAGSNFDTVLVVYVLEGDELVEIACVDDVFFDPIGLSFQASITGPTAEGATYYVQVGGFDARDRGGDVEFGVLKIHVS